MSLKIALFGITRDIVGTSVIELPAPAPATVGALLEELRKQYPALGELRSCAVAVNNEYAALDQPLHTVDEIVPHSTRGRRLMVTRTLRVRTC